MTPIQQQAMKEMARRELSKRQASNVQPEKQGYNPMASVEAAMPGGAAMSMLLPKPPSIANGVDAAQSLGKRIASPLPNKPDWRGINPRSAGETIAGGMLDPRSLVMASEGIVGHSIPGIGKFEPGAMGSFERTPSMLQNEAGGLENKVRDLVTKLLQPKNKDIPDIGASGKDMALETGKNIKQASDYDQIIGQLNKKKDSSIKNRSTMLDNVNQNEANTDYLSELKANIAKYRREAPNSTKLKQLEKVYNDEIDYQNGIGLDKLSTKDLEAHKEFIYGENAKVYDKGGKLQIDTEPGTTQGNLDVAKGLRRAIEGRDPGISDENNTIGSLIDSIDLLEEQRKTKIKDYKPNWIQSLVEHVPFINRNPINLAVGGAKKVMNTEPGIEHVTGQIEKLVQKAMKLREKANSRMGVAGERESNISGSRKLLNGNMERPQDQVRIEGPQSSKMIEYNGPDNVINMPEFPGGSPQISEPDTSGQVDITKHFANLDNQSTLSRLASLLRNKKYGIETYPVRESSTISNSKIPNDTILPKSIRDILERFKERNR